MRDAIRWFNSLEILDISKTYITEFPLIIFKMKNLCKVVAKNMFVEVLDEDFVKLWLQRPDIFTNGRIQKTDLDKICDLHFIIPPNKMINWGPDACMKYYRALKADDAVNCYMLNVTVVGKTAAGFVHSIKEGSSVLIEGHEKWKYLYCSHSMLALYSGRSY